MAVKKIETKRTERLELTSDFDCPGLPVTMLRRTGDPSAPLTIETRSTTRPGTTSTRYTREEARAMRDFIDELLAE